jgi:uncharacterized protein YbjQ (UPF0145 family)
MSWWRNSPSDPDAAAATARRTEQWRQALEGGTLPEFVAERLAEASSGRAPWLSTMSPAELLLARSHGIRPVATVSGTCWFHYGFSWTKGHAEGWHTALARMRQEAVAAGANAIVDVKLRTIHLTVGASMDYTVVGTAVRIDGLPPSADPVIATVPAIEFVRLLEAGIVTTGVAIGAHYDWLTAGMATFTGGAFGMNGACQELTRFWEGIRRQAIDELRADAGRLGNGVLAHTHFGQLIRVDRDKQPPQVLGRHIVIGTAVQCRRSDAVPHAITPVVDMRDDLSPLHGGRPHGHDAYVEADKEGSI